MFGMDYLFYAPGMGRGFFGGRPPRPPMRGSWRRPPMGGGCGPGCGCGVFMLFVIAGFIVASIIGIMFGY